MNRSTKRQPTVEFTQKTPVRAETKMENIWELPMYLKKGKLPANSGNRVLGEYITKSMSSRIHFSLEGDPGYSSILKYFKSRIFQGGGGGKPE